MSTTTPVANMSTQHTTSNSSTTRTRLQTRPRPRARTHKKPTSSSTPPTPKLPPFSISTEPLGAWDSVPVVAPAEPKLTLKLRFRYDSTLEDNRAREEVARTLVGLQYLDASRSGDGGSLSAQGRSRLNASTGGESSARAAQGGTVLSTSTTTSQDEEGLRKNPRKRMASMLTAFNAWQEATEAVNPVDLLPRYTPTPYREPTKCRNRRRSPPKQPWSPPAPRTEKFGPMPSNDLLDGTFFDKHAARFGGKEKIFLYHEHNTRVQKRKAEEIEEMMVQERKKVARYLGGRKGEGKIKRRREAKMEARKVHEMKVTKVLELCMEGGWVDNQMFE